MQEKEIAEGRIQRQGGRFEQAKSSFERALKLARAQNNRRSQVACLINIGLLSWNLGQVKESVGYYEEALSLSKELGLVEEQKTCAAAAKIYELYTEGKKLRDSKRHEESLRTFWEAIGLAREIKSPEHELKCLRQLSLNYSEGEEEFFKLNNLALEIAKVLNHRVEEGRCMNNIGLFYWKSNKFSKALEFLNEALLIFREAERIGSDASACLNNLGLVFRELGDYERALRYLKEALEIDIFLKDDLNIANDLNNIGEIIRNNQESSYKLDAYKYYEMCFDLARKKRNQKLQVYALNNMGFLHQLRLDFYKSIEYLEKAYEICSKNAECNEICNIYCNLGNAYLGAGDLGRAKNYYDMALELAISGRRDEVLWEVYFGLGKCMENMQQIRPALTYYRMSMDVIDSIRDNLALDLHRVGYFRDKFKVYESYLNLLFKSLSETHEEEEKWAFFYAVEKAKARTFIEGLKENEQTEKPENDEALRKLGEISKEISKSLSELTNPDFSEEKRPEIWRRLEEAEDQYIIYLNEIKSKDRENSSIPSLEIFSLESVKNELLDDQTAIVEFFLGEIQSYALLITKRDFVVTMMPGRTNIENSLKAYLKMVSTPSKKKFRGVLAAKRIYKELFGTFDRYFTPSIKHIIIVPDGILYYLPFEALIRERTGKDDGAIFLIETKKISYAPSISSLFFLMKKNHDSQKKKKLLAVGSPLYSVQSSKDSNKKKFEKYEETLRELYLNKGFDFSPLPFSKKEINYISRFFTKGSVDVCTEEGAKEEIIKTKPLSDYQILHFACHAFLDEKTPYRSALVLSLDNDSEEDGFLQVREIQNLKLEANLAILSACQTGKGKLENGEGVFGLPRAFFYAGALSTISTLWKVDDKATSEFMRHLYNFLAQGNDKAEALRLAKIKMIKSASSHPFFWAGFILNGDYKRELSFH